ncbi:MAG: VWA domain-containing protein, partial [Candidatus Latescibacteria bacterium]|jgi:hypothetical protein|nr:VWA domain-containing protein [Candidatus Latescibacterota bacterium]
MVRFSSLMFVPDIKREVIERRRIQHVLLMLLRMALLVLLALAFARPFQEMLLGAETPEAGATHHVIVLDTSLSMATDGVWERAKEQAKAVLEDVLIGDRVGLMRFAQTVVVDVPISEDVDLVRRAIDAADVTWEHTDYVAALQAAAQMFAVDTSRVKQIVHLISDFQVSGMPVSDAGWRLPGTIVLDAVAVGSVHVSNASVDALAVQPLKDDLLQIRARVRNWLGPDALSVQLVVADKVVDTRAVTVMQGNATQVGFSVPVSGQVAGYVAVVGGDALLRDDQRFFAWHQKPRHRVEVLGNDPVLKHLLEAAVPKSADLPWRLESSDSQLLDGAVVIADAIDAAMVEKLAGYVQKGGALFLPLNRDADVNVLNSLLVPMGIRVGDVYEGGYAELSWVNLEHRVFQPFKGARFNDFSSVRYNNYHELMADSSAVVLAKLDDDSPVIVEGGFGHGRVFVWAGGLGLGRSNLARTPRFVPLLHETLRYLAGDQKVQTDYQVGEGVRIEGEVEQIVGPGGSLRAENGRMHAAVPGVYQWEEGRQVVAVNVVDRESNLAQVTPAEFEIRLCDAPVLFQKDGEDRVVSDLSVQHEYGQWALIVLFILLVVEHVYASLLGARGEVA